jgi:hypothetical protein
LAEVTIETFGDPDHQVPYETQEHQKHGDNDGYCQYLEFLEVQYPAHW